MLRDIWKDPVWSKVIASAIVGAAVIAGTYFLNWWPNIGAAAGQATAFLGDSSSLPNWALGLLAVATLPTLFIAGILVWDYFQPKTSLKRDWRLYVEDTFFGLHWRWKYVSGNISDLHTFCPHCDFQVFHQDTSTYGVPRRIQYDCDSCHRHLGSLTDSYIAVESKVERFIHQKLRNESWPERSDA